MKKSEPFNRKIFAMLLEKAKGDRSTKQFAADCGISYVQLHKLELQAQPGAPGMKLITKLAANSAGGIDDRAFSGIDEAVYSSALAYGKNRKFP